MNQPMVPERGSPAQGLPSVGSMATSQSAASVSQSGIPILTRARLQELVREIDPSEQLDEEVSIKVHFQIQ